MNKPKKKCNCKQQYERDSRGNVIIPPTEKNETNNKEAEKNI